MHFFFVWRRCRKREKNPQANPVQSVCREPEISYSIDRNHFPPPSKAFSTLTPQIYSRRPICQRRSSKPWHHRAIPADDTNWKKKIRKIYKLVNQSTRKLIHVLWEEERTEWLLDMSSLCRGQQTHGPNQNRQSWACHLKQLTSC
jgi:hypothetical protein